MIYRKTLGLGLTLLGVASLMLLPGCNKGLGERQGGNGGEEGDSFVVSIAKGGIDTGNGLGSDDGGVTKTDLSSEGYVCWSEGDKIWVNGIDGDHTLTVLPMGSESTEAMVSGNVSANGSGVKYIGHYPASNTYWNTSTWEVKLPESRTYNVSSPLDGVPMFAQSDSKRLTFNTPFAIMEFSFRGNKNIRSLTLTCESGNLSGNFIINSNGMAELSSSGNSTVTVDFGGGFVPGNKGSVYLALAPGKYTNLTIEVKTDASFDWGGIYYKRMSGSITVNKGSLYCNSFDTDNWEGVLMWYPAAGEKGLYWATRNVGATCGSTVESWMGDYFCWGSTKVIYSSISIPPATNGTIVMSSAVPPEDIKDKYPIWASYWSSGFNAWGTTPYCNLGSGTPADGNFKKYNSTDKKTTLDLIDDAARCNLGGNWRMPTGGSDGGEMMKLFEACGGDSGTPVFETGFVEWIPDYPLTGMSGLYLKSKSTGGELIFPANGVFRGKTNTYLATPANRIVMMWTSSNLYESGMYTYQAYRMSVFANGSISFGNARMSRCDGYGVRGVKEL